LSYCFMNNANRSCVRMSSTFSNSHVLSRYLHSFVHVSFNYRTASTRCSGYRQQTTVQTTWLMSTGPLLSSSDFD